MSSTKLKLAAITALTLLITGFVVAEGTQEENQTLDNETEIPGDSEEAEIRVPGDRLYALTSVSERVERGMANAPVIGGPDRQAQVEANHADRRLQEAEVLAERGNSERAEQAAERYGQGIERAVERANESSNNETKDRISDAFERQQETLERVREQVPEQAQQGIENAIENSQQARESVGPPEHAGPNNQTGEAPEDAEPGAPDQPENETGQQQPDPENETGQPEDENQTDNETPNGPPE